MLNDIGQGLKTRLETVATFKRVYAPDEVPDLIGEVPCAIILPSTMTYHRDLDGALDANFRIVCLLGLLDKPSSFSSVMDLITTVPAAIEADRSLGGTVGDCIVTENLGASTTEWTKTLYLSTEFLIKIYA